MLTLALGLVQFIWTMLDAVVVRVDSLTVQAMSLSAVTLVTWRMLEYGVEVRRYFHRNSIVV